MVACLVGWLVGWLRWQHEFRLKSSHGLGPPMLQKRDGILVHSAPGFGSQSVNQLYARSSQAIPPTLSTGLPPAVGPSLSQPLHLHGDMQ